MTRVYSRAERVLARAILGLLALAALVGVGYGERVLLVGPAAPPGTLSVLAALDAIGVGAAVVFDVAAVLGLCWGFGVFMEWILGVALGREQPASTRPA